MQPLLHIAVTAARLAGELIVRYMDSLDRITVTSKGTNDFFTDIDVKAEQLIIKTILKAYPDHGIMAEESGCQNLESDSIWIIDPLDGTSNFMHGYPFYAVSIGVKIKNRIEHAVVLDPIRQECFTASRGRGAQLNDRRLRVSKQSQLSAALLGTSLPSRDPALAKRYFPTFEAMVGKCAGMRRSGSAALDMAYVAAGRLDGYWKFGLQPWDMAAGSLLIKEAGGLISDLQGGENYINQGDVVAGNPKIFKSLLQIVGRSNP